MPLRNEIAPAHDDANVAIRLELARGVFGPCDAVDFHSQPLIGCNEFFSRNQAISRQPGIAAFQRLGCYAAGHHVLPVAGVMRPESRLISILTSKWPLLIRIKERPNKARLLSLRPGG